MGTYRFKVTGRVATGRLLDALASGSSLESAAPYAATRCHLDTFDWGLWRNGGRLTLETRGESTVAFWEPGSGRPLRRTPVRGDIDFAHDLPPGPVRREVAGVTGGRALLEVGRTAVRRRLVRIVDAEGKTRVRLWLDTLRPLKDGAPAGTRRRLVTVDPLVGYAAEGEAAGERLRALPGLELAEDDDLALATAAIGRSPGDYTPKVVVALRPAEPAERAVRRILLRLDETTIANVDGTVRDLDTEFLHDLRVATRRTRTCLGQLGSVFPTAVIETFAEEFRWLASATNSCRDLDVFLAQLERHKASLAPDQAAALSPLIERLRAARFGAHRELSAVLESERFESLMRRWRRVLGRRFIGGERGTAPVFDVAADRTLRAYRRLSSRARGLDPDSPAAELHRLRIDAKKLRYLLEFFSSLWDRQAAGALIAELKLVQDSLGDYHDAWLQSGMLTALAPEVLTSGAGAATLLAMGGLVAELGRRQRSEAERVLSRLRTFASVPVQRRLVRLVEGRGNG